MQEPQTTGIYPFCGIRYSDEGLLADCIAPPYDVITLEHEKLLLGQHPHNIVRVILGKKGEFQRLPDAIYQEAGETFKKWLSEGVLQQEDAPALYVCEQVFKINDQTFARTGFFCEVDLEEPGKGRIKPHEVTFSGPKEDRYRLMCQTQAQMSAVFSLYSDPQHAVSSLLNPVVSQPPYAAFSDDSGVGYRVWVIRDTAIHQAIQKALEGRDLFIADGHHRCETAWRYAQQDSENPASQRVLMFLCAMENEGLVVLPTHRFVGAIKEGLDLETALDKDFRVEKFDRIPTADALKRLEHAKMPGTLLFCTKTHWLLAQYKGDMASYRGLDVELLHRYVLDDLLDMADDWQDHNAMTYDRDEEGLMQRIHDGGPRCLGIFMNHTPISKLRELVQEGQRMPQKSTYFYPKIPTGLVIRSLNQGL